MTESGASRGARWIRRTTVGAICLLGAALRLYRLGHWSLEGDELNTLRDSLVTSGLHGTRPLLFFLNYHLIAPWHPLDEVGLRIFPVLFGIAAVPVTYLLVRRALDPVSGIFAALIVAVDPALVYWSQYGRYYSLVFFFSSVAIIAGYVGFRERRAGWIVLALLSGLLAVLAHPSAGLVLVGIGFWIAAMSLSDIGRREGAWQVPRMWVIGIAIILGVLALLRFIPELKGWVGLHQTWGHVGIALLLSYLDHLSIVASCFAIAGLVWLWRLDRRALVLLIVLVTAVPVVFLTAVSWRMSVSTGYLLATVPAVIIAAAAFLAETLRHGAERWSRRLVTTACLFALLGSEAPPLVSQYLDGGRADFRAAAAFLETHIKPEDGIVSDQPRTLKYYLRTAPVEGFERDPATLETARAALAPGAALWIVEAVWHRGGFREVDLAGATGWVRGHCTLEMTKGAWRLDYKHNAISVYRCAGQ